MATKKIPLSTPLRRLSLPRQVFNLLQSKCAIMTIGELLSWSRAKLLSKYGIGPVAVRQIAEALTKIGYELAPDPPPPEPATPPPPACCNYCGHWIWRGGATASSMGACTKLNHTSTAATAVCPAFEPSPLTAAEINRRVEEIRDCAGDDEAAHVKEDDLYRDFARSLAARRDEIGRKARLVLQTRLIGFTRHCA